MSEMGPEALEVAATGPIAGRLERWRYPLLGLIVIVAAGVRAHALSSGSLYRDDAWVVLTNRVPLGTAVRMLSSSPGFTLFERSWSSLAPHTTWFLQLPNFLMSLAAIVAMEAFLRWRRHPAWISLLGAVLLATSGTAADFATHLKPYSFNILGTLCLLWLAERFWRRGGMASLAWLALASIAICCCSLTMAAVAGAVFGVLVADALSNRGGAAKVVGAAVVGLGPVLVVYWAVQSQLTPALQHSWRRHYISLGSPKIAFHSARANLSALIRGLTFFPHDHLLKVVGYLNEAVVVFLIIVAICTALRREILAVAVLAVAIGLAIVHRMPIGTTRTDTYLYPCLIILAMAGLRWVAPRLAARWPALGRAAAVGLLSWVLLMMGVRVATVVDYPGSNLRPALTEVHKAMRVPGSVLLVEGTARWPWAYYEEPRVALAFGPTWNTGFTPVSTMKDVVISPHTGDEPGFNPGAVVESLRFYRHIVTLNFRDYTGLRDPLQAALVRHCWVPVSHKVYGAYAVNQLLRNPNPACTPQ